MANIVNVRKVSTKQIEFSSYFSTDVTEIYLDDICFCPAEQLINCTDEHSIKLYVCSCGVNACDYGGWVTFRKYRDDVLIVPCCDEELDLDPDHWLFNDAQALLLTESLYQDLKAVFDIVPDFNALKPPKNKEIAKMILFDVPDYIFEDPLFDIKNNNIKIKKEFFIATNDNLNEKILDAIELKLSDIVSSEEPADLKPSTGLDVCEVYFYQEDVYKEPDVNNGAFTDWRPLVKQGDNYYLAITPDFHLKI